MNQPNILFLFSDQQRWDTLGCYNPAIDFTPNLDRLAAEGVRFENAFTCQPVCGPARACLQTGLYAAQLGCYRNGVPLPQGIPTIADRFNQSGYETAYIGKWHLSRNDVEPIPEHERGGYRDYWLAAGALEFTSDSAGGYMHDTDNERVDFEGYRVDCIADFVIDYLKNRRRERPFFLFTSWIEPHFQNTTGHHEGPPGSKERFRDYEVPGDLRALEGDWAAEFPDYLGCCASLDENVGRIVQALKDIGEYENTLIVYTSDHGSHFRTRNDEYKRSCHDGCARIPMIVRGPGFTGGKVADGMASLIDLPVTLLEAGDIELQPLLQGNPLQRIASGDTEGWPEEAFIQVSETQVGRAIRTQRWKYAVVAPDRHGWLHANADSYDEAFLYDLEQDPHELYNLIGQAGYDEVRAGLRQRLIKRMVSAGELAPIIKYL